jgi:hypothetical protein
MMMNVAAIVVLVFNIVARAMEIVGVVLGIS